VVAMVTKKEFNNSIKKAKDWDGKSRVSNDTYRKRWHEIFGKKELDELDESLKQSKRNKAERTKDIIDTVTSSDKKADLVNTILERKRAEMHDKKK
jgi:hypothetical protein